MKELSQKLKEGMVQYLRNKHNPDQTYVISGLNARTANQLADEIENETEFGVNTLCLLMQTILYKFEEKNK